MNALFDAAYFLALIAISPIAAYRVVRHGRYRKGWGNRLGRIKRKATSKPCIWIHAVSVGEVNATQTLIPELKTRFPDHEIVLSTTTDTGFARANNLYSPQIDVFFFPMDFSVTMTRAFDALRPNLILLVELEIWPNLADIASKRHIPVVVINGRLSEKSHRRYKLIKPIIAPMFRKIALILAQTEEYAQRFRDIGTPPEKVIVAGSLKYDTAQTTDRVEGADQLRVQLQLSKEDTLWVAGATGNGEEGLILDVYEKLKADFRNLRLAIVPRKPERFDEVAQLITARGLELTRYAPIKQGKETAPVGSKTVILGDTMGDLRKFYSLADLIFVGRTLVPMGGSDMMEAAALGKTTIFGPHASNFKQTVDALLAGNGAILVRDANGLLQAMQKCLTNPDYSHKIALAGRQIIRNNQGATQRTVEQLESLLKA